MKFLLRKKIQDVKNAETLVYRAAVQDELATGSVKLEMKKYASSTEGISSFFFLGMVKGILSDKKMNKSDATILVGKKILAGWLSSTNQAHSPANDDLK